MADFGSELRNLGPVPDELLHALDGRMAAIQGEWLTSDRVKPNKFDAFRGSTLHIVFQYPVDLHSHRESQFTPLWEDWGPVIQPLIDHVTPWYGYREPTTSRIMLARLLPGREISPHVDRAPAAEVPNKVHIPLITHPEVRFHIGEGTYQLERGVAYEVNNRVRHAVTNGSELDRVHLIFDVFDAG